MIYVLKMDIFYIVLRNIAETKMSVEKDWSCRTRLERVAGYRCKCVFELRNFVRLPLNFSIKRIPSAKNFR